MYQLTVSTSSDLIKTQLKYILGNQEDRQCDHWTDTQIKERRISMKKKLICLALVLAMCLSLVACGTTEVSDNSNPLPTQSEEPSGDITENPVDTETETIIIENFAIELPKYWDENGSKPGNDYKQYYAETGGVCVMLSIDYSVDSDESYEVSYDGLTKDNENMISSIEAIYDCTVDDWGPFVSNGGVKGILYQFNCNIEGIETSGLWFCFPSSLDRRWFNMIMLQTHNAERDCYVDDFIASLSSITPYESPVDAEPLPTLSPEEVQIPLSYIEYIGENYEEVVATLAALGFTNITAEPSYDIYFGLTEEKSIKSISISGNSSFQGGDIFGKGSTIIIVYHMPYEEDPSYIKMPHESDYYDGMDYLEVAQLFKDLGFTNIVTTSKTSSISDDGEVFSIVYGEYSFEFYEGEVVKKDEQVTIKYYVAETPVPEEKKSEYEKAYIRDMSNYDLYYMFDTDTKTVVYFGTNDTYLERGTYTGDFSTGVTITWGHAEWTEKFTHKGGNYAVLIDGSGWDWEYQVCDISKAQKVLDSLQ